MLRHCKGECTETWHPQGSSGNDSHGFHDDCKDAAVRAAAMMEMGLPSWLLWQHQQLASGNYITMTVTWRLWLRQLSAVTLSLLRCCGRRKNLRCPSKFRQRLVKKMWPFLNMLLPILLAPCRGKNNQGSNNGAGT